MSRWRILLAVMAAAMILSAAAAAGIRPETRWADPSRVQLDVEFPGDGYRGSWEVDRCRCGDLLVRAELAVPGERVSGDLLLVEQSAVLSRGFGQYKAEAAASLDAAALMLQLALRLLERAEPAGPNAVQAGRTVEVEDTINPILLDTGSAMGGFQAPWSVRGTLAPDGAERRRFDLTFDFTAITVEGRSQGSMRLQGTADFSGHEFPVAGSSSLEEWALDWRDPGDALPQASEAATLDDLRALLRAD